MNGLEKLEIFFKNKKNIILIGKGSNIDQINFEDIYFDKKETLIININDSETIYRGSFSIVSNKITKKRFEKKILEPLLSFYISDQKILNCKTYLIDKNLGYLNEPGLIISQIQSDDVKFYNHALLTAVHISSYFAKKNNLVLETYFLGFDFKNYKDTSNHSINSSTFENKEYSNKYLHSQYEYLKLLIPISKSLNLNLKHIGDSPFSLLSYGAFQKLFSKKGYSNKGLIRNFSKIIENEKDRNNFYKVKIVAEITTNHFGDKERLFAMIKAVAESGADYVKFQKRDVESFYNSDELNLPYQSPFGNNFRDYRLALELSDEDFIQIDSLCKKLKIGWFASILDIKSFQSFLKLKPKMIKLPSTISDHKDYIKFVSKNFKGTIVLSTGYTDKKYEKFIINQFKSQKMIYLLHCVSAYPAPENETNISILKNYHKLSLKYKNIVPGYSSHDLGSLCSQIAVACGALMIEKHVKFGEVSWAHFDNVALDLATNEFKNFVNDIRKIEKIMGTGIKKIQPSENHKYWLKKK